MKLSTISLLALAGAASAKVAPLRPVSKFAMAKKTAVELRGGALQAPVSVPGTALQSSNNVRGGGSPIDLSLITYFALWFWGNAKYNIWNKLALKACKTEAYPGGFPMTISCLQLGVGVVYALFLWLAPDGRAAPTVTLDDIKKMLPVGICAAGAHSASVFALGAGSVSFGQIVKSAEPAFSAVLSNFVYGKKVSKGKWLMLIPIIGGVMLASMKELDFAVSALVAACIANLFAAVKGNENKKLMDTPGLKDRIGSVGNQFALTTILSFLISVPLMMGKEGSEFGAFKELWNSSPALRNNLILSGLSFYGYNELATMTIKKTNAVTQSVANTAKRVLVIINSALVLGESIEPQKLFGCAVAVLGVMCYSLVDNFFPPAF
jgi:solute carrier family 35 protein E1